MLAFLLSLSISFGFLRPRSLVASGSGNTFAADDIRDSFQWIGAYHGPFSRIANQSRVDKANSSPSESICTLSFRSTIPCIWNFEPIFCKRYTMPSSQTKLLPYSISSLVLRLMHRVDLCATF